MSVTYLGLLVLMKVKILRGYPFLWPRNFQPATHNLLAKLGVFNPLFYIDDLFIAFIMFVGFYCIFKKNNSKLNIAVYVLYFAICFFSILSALVFYKYEVPLNLAVLGQIDSLYYMRTSIDTELRENYRLIWFSIILLLFAVATPVLIKAFLSKFLVDAGILEKSVHVKVLVLTTFCLLLIGLLVKSNYAGSNVIAETPFTTFSYSVLKNFQNRVFEKSSKIPGFNDQIQLGHGSIDRQGSLLADKHRKKYNVILVVLETTNYKFFLPGGPYIQYFPNLDHMGKQGLYFSKFFSPFPRSSKAFFAILTGRYPLTNYKSIIKVAPQIRVPTLFSILKNNGYSTFAGYSGDFNYDRMAEFLKGRGVDKLVDIKDNNGQYRQISWCADDELIYDQFIHWISALPENSPFFGLLLTMNSHHPFWSPKKELAVIAENSKVDRYLNAMHYQDYLLGKLFRYLKDSGKLNKTIVVVTGDHGAVFKTLEPGDGNTGTEMIDYTPYRVPLFIYTPFETPSNMENEIIGNHVDILPTILDMLGIGLKMPVQGRSLFDPLIKNRMSYIYTDYYKHIVTGLNGNYYMMRDMTEDYTVLSNNLHLHPDICENSNELCQHIKVKIDDFDQHQNQRLYEYF